MIKHILLLGLLGVLNFSILQAQNTKPEIQVNLDEFNVESLSQSERILINILVQKKVKQLEQHIEQLNADKEFGRITKAEYEKQKHLVSDEFTDKIGRSIDILTNPEYYHHKTEEPFHQFKKSLSDSTFKNSSNKVYIKYNLGEDRKELSIKLNGNDSICSSDSTTSSININGNIGFGFTNWMDSDHKRYDDPLKKLTGGSSWYYEIGLKANSYLDKEHKKTSIDYGITLISKYYHFNDERYSINHENNGVAMLDDVQITESVFSQTSLEFPLTITHRFTNSYQERLAISAGLYGGFNIRSRQKIKYSVNNQDYKAKWFGDFNTNPFYAGARVSIGYNSIYLIGRYNFTEVFKSSSEIEVYPYTIGVSFGL